MYAQDYKTCGTDEMMEKAFELTLHYEKNRIN